MCVTSQVMRQSVLIYYDSVSISMHMPLLTCNKPIALAVANMISTVSYSFRWVD